MRLLSIIRISFFAASVLIGSGGLAGSAYAISETGYATEFNRSVLPFLATGTPFKVKAFDGLELSAVKFIHPVSTPASEFRGTLLVVNGRTESWSKYAEVFYDLYHAGYDIYAYDHRGQGKSPHLVAKNPQIGYVERFSDYVYDLNRVVHVVTLEARDSSRIFLLAHSMGGAITSAYLEAAPAMIKAAVLVSPMLQIITKPYPEPVAESIVGAATLAGLGKAYALKQGDYNWNEKFQNNGVTTSRARYSMGRFMESLEPGNVLGGASNGWVYRSLVASKKIRARMGFVKTPILMLQAGHDQIVERSGEVLGCARAAACTGVLYPKAEHEILMERDSIRDNALERLTRFLK